VNIRETDRVCRTAGATIFLMSLRRSLAAATFAVALAACGGADAVESAGTSAPETTTEAPASEEQSSAEAVPVVYDTVAGGQLDFGSLEGQDTVLWFWAPW
jgi:hypothetical protein